MQASLTLVLLVSVVFFLGRMAGDPVSTLLPETADADTRTALSRELGLDKPALIQYFDYVAGLAHGDLGRSYRSNRPVASLLADRLPNSLYLAVVAVAFAIAVAVPLGVVAALRRNSLLDRSLVILSVAAQSIPAFWLGLVMILIFSVKLRILPTAGIGGPPHFVMPAVTLSGFMIAGLFRLTRSSMVEIMNADFIKFARIKGLSEARVIFVHALRNALLAPLTFLAVYFGLIAGGTVIIETVFSWPGMGRLAYEAILTRDLPVVQGVLIVTSSAVILSNLVADLLYGVIDPRIRY